MAENGDDKIDDAYKAAGVDIEAGEALIRRIAPAAKATRRPGADASLGGFGAAFDLKAAGFNDPVLVAATDGVGTKLLIAEAVDDHRGVGIDLVAMCVNDLVAQGAEPLFFLDYFATGRLELDQATAVIEGVAEGCKQAGAALIGGETAEMPGVYPVGRYDLAGFAVGAVERGGFINGDDVAPGDVAIALPSSGVHSNGFSLVRRIIEQAGLAYSDPAPFQSGDSLGAALLAPTRIYAKPCVAAARAGLVCGMAHITGGGLVENPPRAFGKHLALEVDLQSIAMPPVFDWLHKAGAISAADMTRTFNCGVGMLIYVRAADADAALASLADAGAMNASVAGRIIEKQDGPAVRIAGLDRWGG